MNKAILMSIQPKWVAKILNGEKNIEVRKKFPKDYVGWVYIYCTKKDSLSRLIDYPKNKYVCEQNFKCEDFPKLDSGYEGKGKVVARFWCDKVSVIECVYCLTIPTIAYTTFLDKRYGFCSLLKASCLYDNEIMRYLGTKEGQVGYAIHISKLEVFDKPKELKEFRHTCKAEYRGYNRWQPCSKECKNCVCNQLDDEGYSQCFSRLEKAPQSYMFVEGE